MRYEIFIDKLECFGFHGVLEEEKRLGQKFIISSKLTVNSPEGVEEDNCEKTVNYAQVCELMAQIAENERYDLIETLADTIAKEILIKFSMVEKVTVHVDKPGAPIRQSVENVGVEVKRGWHTAYLGVGSNMGDTLGNISEAMRKLQDSPFNSEVVLSELIKTKPYGYTQQDDFINGVCSLKTILTPEELLGLLHQIENDLKRTREIHWGPRTIDLDILLFDNLVMEEPDLTIPHPQMCKRDFVLKPLLELNPRLVNPLTHQYFADIFEELQGKDWYEKTV